MAWVVGHFIKDNSVEVVPSSWIITKANNSKECLWPPYTNKSKLYNSVVHRESPQCDWKHFEINVLGSYDNLDVAKKKCSRAEETDELSSTDINDIANENEKSNRHIRRQKNYSIDEYYYDYDPDRPKFPSKKSNVDNSSDSDERNITSRKLNTVQKKHSQKKVDKADTAQYSDHSSSLGEIVEEVSNVRTYTIDSNNFLRDVECLDQEVAEKQPTQFNKNVLNFINKSYEFQRQIVKEVFIIKCLVKENREVLDGIIKKIQREEQPDDKVDNTAVKDILNKCPIRFDEDLFDMDDQLKDGDLLNAVAKELSLLGGDNIKDMTSKILYFILSNKIASLYSWEGQKGKRKFKDLKIAILVIKTIRKRHETATETEIVGRIKTWLVQAKFREIIRNKRNEKI